MDHDDVLFAIGLPIDPVLVRLKGLVVVDRLDRVAQLLAIAEEHPGPVYDVDLTGVSFLDSRGVAFLLEFRSTVIRGSGRVRFVGASPRVRRILERAGVGALLYDARPGSCGTPFAA